ncbi:MAG TPA: hypothetical protein VGM91_07555 [Conexibacter sp.]|jgi:hypothetical protein
MAARRNATEDRWSELSRSELIALGRALVTERLESIGCTVQAPTGRGAGMLGVRTPTGRMVEVFVSTQRVGGYAVWTKRRFAPAEDRYAAVVLLGEAEEPVLYVVPSTTPEWHDAAGPFTNRDNVGKKSEAEWGISLAHSSLPALERFAWDARRGREYFR